MFQSFSSLCVFKDPLGPVKSFQYIHTWLWLFSSAKKKIQKNSLYTCELFWSPFLLSITLFIFKNIYCEIIALAFQTSPSIQAWILVAKLLILLPAYGLGILWKMDKALGCCNQYGRPGRSSVPPISVSLSLVLWSFGKWICGGKLFLSLSHFNFDSELQF